MVRADLQGEIVMNVYHVYPLNDDRTHETDGDSCHCKPRVEEYENGGKVVIHNSYDCREYVEQAAEIFRNPDAILGAA